MKNLNIEALGLQEMTKEEMREIYGGKQSDTPYWKAIAGSCVVLVGVCTSNPMLIYSGAIYAAAAFY